MAINIMDYMPQWGQALGTQDVSTMPMDESMAQLQLKRKLAKAEALRNAQAPQGQMVSGHFVKPSWTQYLANALGQIQGGQEERQAMQDYGQFQKGRQAKIAELLAGKEVEQPVDLPSAVPGQTQKVRQPYSREEFMSRASEVMPELQDEMIKAQVGNYFKEDQPMVVGKNLVTKSGKVLFTAPPEAKEFAPSNLSKLQEEMIAIQKQNPNDPRLPSYQAAIKKETEFAPPMQVVSLPAPQVAINPRTNQPELVQFPNKPGMQPQFTGIKPYEKPEKLKAIPAGPATAFSENNTAIRKIDEAIAKVQAAPESSFGAKNYLGGAITQRIDPKGNAARAAVAGVGGQKYHDLSGAAVAVQEAARLSPYIPQVTDTKEKILQNLNNLRNEYQYTNDTLQSTFSEDQGYKPLQSMPSRTPSAPAQSGWSIKKVQ